MDLAARILDKLRQSPFSVEELTFDLKRKPFEVRYLPRFFSLSQKSV